MTLVLQKIREKNLTDSLLFNVTRQSIVTSEGHKILGKKAIVNPRGDVLGIVSDKYKVVTNAEILTHVGEALEASGIQTEGFDIDATVGYGGARAMVNFTFPSHQIAVKGDKSTLRMTILNSYDGRWKFRAYAGALRHACMNGQVFGARVSAYSDYHTKRLDVEAGAARMFKMAEEFGASEVWYNAMFERKVDREQLLRSIAIYLTGSSKIPNREDFVASKRVATIVDLFDTYSKEFGANAYALYNALTDHVTHSKYNERTKAGMLRLNEEKLETLISKSSLFAPVE